jgi:hypothetical protein
MERFVKVEQVYNQIDEQRALLIKLLNQSSKSPISPARLSDVCVKLAILNELLGGFIPELKQAQLEAEKAAFTTAKDDKKSDTAAKEMARWQTHKERRAFEEADVKHSDLWKLISMAQSHIRAEGEERRNM